MAVDPKDPPVLSPDGAAKLPTWRAAYSDRTSALMAAFCQLAYVPFEVNPPKPAPRTPKATAPDGGDKLGACLAGGGFQLTQVFNRDDTQAFLAVKSDEFAVLAFRGTTDFQDWVTNLKGRQVAMPTAPAVFVHEGFLSAFECCRDDIVAAVNRAVPPDLGLYITGHSLGGALAQIASAVLERDNLAACYTYGSPRVGRANFDRLVKCPHYRLIDNWDLVPGVPPPWFSGYRHSGDPRLLTPKSAGQEALRRDRFGPARFWVDLRTSVQGLFDPSHRFLAIDDHMIWNYRTQLEAIADARTQTPPSQRGA